MLTVSEVSAAPSMSALLGSKGDTTLLNHINNLTNSAYFGSAVDRFAPQYDTFLTKFIVPIREASLHIQHTAARLNNLDRVIQLRSEQDLRDIPSCMMVPIITHAPMYKLLRQGRIEGWGFNPDYLDDAKEMYDRIIDTNGVVDFGEEPDTDEPDTYLCRIVEDSEDVEMTFEEREMHTKSREFVSRFLETSDLDPTNLDNLRG